VHLFDTFCRVHREIVLRSFDRAGIWGNAFKLAHFIARDPPFLPDQSLTLRSSSFREYEHWYSFHLQRLVPRMAKLFFEDESLKLNNSTRKLLEVVVLQSWAIMIEGLGQNENNHSLYTSYRTLSVMIQRELMLLFGEIHYNQIDSIHSIGASFEGRRLDWEAHVAGATAASYVLMALCARDDTRVYLPTPLEDANLSADLFCIVGDLRLVVSIKGIASNRHIVTPYSAGTRIIGEHKKGSLEHEINSVHDGAAEIALRDRRDHQPVLIQVLRERGGALSLDRDWTSLKWPGEMIRTIKELQEQRLAERTLLARTPPA
jgi:hypothetical protein